MFHFRWLANFRERSYADGRKRNEQQLVADSNELDLLSRSQRCAAE